MDKDIPKIKCETKEVWRNKITGQIYEDEKEANFALANKPEDIVKDVTITVSNEGLELLEEIMSKKGK